MKSFKERLHAAIPGGAHTYSRGDDQFPENAPQILARGRGAYVWDGEGRRYLDYGMGLRAVTLGYAHPEVNAAAIREIENGVNLTRPSTVELDAAELFSELIRSAEMVKFAKNGSNVTTAAVKIARAVTSRRYVCIPRQHPFFSFDDWFIGITPIKRGIPPEHYSSTLLFDYNDLNSLEELFQRYPDQIAAVLLEPATTVGPCPSDCGYPTREVCAGCAHHAGNFLHRVRELAHDKGALFVLDEMITGFRWHTGGAQAYYGVEPDLCTFGKAMANGFSIAALGGKREFMEAGGIDKEGTERTFLMSATHGAEMPPLAAFIASVAIYRREDVIGHLWRYGRRLIEEGNAIARGLGIEQFFFLEGYPALPNPVTRGRDGAGSLPMRTLFGQEMIRRGVLMPWICPSLAHGDAELEVTLEAMRGALGVYRRALDDGWERYLVGPPIKPVFRKIN
jgi:glutamate-1-semialdehyde 2,1-aminomutase